MGASVTIGLWDATYSHAVSGGSGLLRFDAAGRIVIVGSPEQLRALADQVLELADRVDWSAGDALRRAEEREQWETDRRAAREASDAGRLPRWEREFLAGGDVA